jgi:formate/nitrite transporter FocA (FNT family)
LFSITTTTTRALGRASRRTCAGALEPQAHSAEATSSATMARTGRLASFAGAPAGYGAAVAGRAPDEIWGEAIDEGERRLTRSPGALAATGFVGGADVMLGVMALAATEAAFTKWAGPEVAHFMGSLVFGLGFVFLIVGRGELFTENFLVPVSAVFAKRCHWRLLLRLWGITFLTNYLGILLFAAIFAKTGVLRAETLTAAGTPADVLCGRGVGAAFLSGVVAGAVMTLMTWLTHASEYDFSRILIALIIGFVIAIATMNHAVVSFGETMLAYIAGTTKASLGDIAGTLAIAVAGNLVGGLGLVTVNRLIQARGEPG